MITRDLRNHFGSVSANFGRIIPKVVDSAGAPLPMMMIRHKMLLTMVGVRALAVSIFPDFTIGDLQQRSAPVTLQTAATINFSPTAVDALFQMPNSVIDVIPTMVMEHISQERPLIVNRNLDLVDLFAGKARIARWATLAGLHAIAFDKLYGEHMDILTPVGLALIVLLVLRIKVGGLLAAGPQSSRKVTKRTKKNPYAKSNQSVFDGNATNSLMALLCYLGYLLSWDWLIEQPQRTLFFETQMMKAVKETIANVSTCSLNLGNFGHETQKPTILMGTNNIVQKLKNEEQLKDQQAKRPKDSKKRRKVVKKKPSKKKAKKPASLVNIRIRANGTKAVTGKTANLQMSAIYPVQYALAICQLQWPAHFVHPM